jgi:hypothetical protein
MNSLILETLNTAEAALRENLHRHGLDPTAREHMERAMSHVREAYVATNAIGKARSVRRLVRDLEKVERFVEKVRRRRQIGIAAKPVRV